MLLFFSNSIFVFPSLYSCARPSPTDFLVLTSLPFPSFNPLRILSSPFFPLSCSSVFYFPLSFPLHFPTLTPLRLPSPPLFLSLSPLLLFSAFHSLFPPPFSPRTPIRLPPPTSLADKILRPKTPPCQTKGKLDNIHLQKKTSRLRQTTRSYAAQTKICLSLSMTKMQRTTTATKKGSAASRKKTQKPLDKIMRPSSERA